MRKLLKSTICQKELSYLQVQASNGDLQAEFVVGVIEIVRVDYLA